MIVPPTAAANSSASIDLPLAVGPAIRMTGGWAGETVAEAGWKGAVRPSRRALRALLRMRSFFNAMKKAYLMLRIPRSGRLEARRLPMQPVAPRRCPSEPGHDRDCRSQHRANAARYRGRSNRGVAPGGGAGLARARYGLRSPARRHRSRGGRGGGPTGD